MAQLVFLVALFFLSIGVAYEQSLTIYNELDYIGIYLGFQSKESNTSNLDSFFVGLKSIKSKGYWRVFSESNFTGQSISAYNVEAAFYHFPFNGASVRHSGPLDTSEQSISFYSEKGFNGIERVITTPASNDIPFAPASILSTGSSNWTFFTGASFNGTATCYISTAETHALYYDLNSTLTRVQSIIRGCLGRIDTFLFAQDCEEKSMPVQDFILN